LINFLRKLLEIKPNECKTCLVYKEQLEYERTVNQELTETITSLIKPKLITQENANLGAPVPIINRGQIFSRRREALERADKESLKLQNNSKVIGKPDDKVKENNIKENDIKIPANQSIEQLEKELGIVESKAEDA